MLNTVCTPPHASQHLRLYSVERKGIVLCVTSQHAEEALVCFYALCLLLMC